MSFKFKSTKAAAVAVALVVSGCGQVNVSGEQTAMLLGGALGGAAGGYVGSQFGGGLGQTLYIVAGAAGGALVGAAAGPGLFGTDWDLHVDATEEAVTHAASAPRYWSNPDSGNEGMVRALDRFNGENGQQCRRYRSTVWVDGVVSSGNGSACQANDGEWQVVADRFG